MEPGKILFIIGFGFILTGLVWGTINHLRGNSDISLFIFSSYMLLTFAIVFCYKWITLINKIHKINQTR